MKVSELKDDDVEWIVNDNGELGVKIGEKAFFLYKGRSLTYESGKHDDGRPMMYRPVKKREFGECCHPVNYDDVAKCGHPHMIGAVSLQDSENWKELPAIATLV